MVASTPGMTEILVPDPGVTTGRKLTPREREVLQHAAGGMSNRQIGEAMDIAEQTGKQTSATRCGSSPCTTALMR